jgi:hypothetical protein
MIKTIDLTKNGYITDQELQDIIKASYPDKLNSYDFKALF